MCRYLLLGGALIAVILTPSSCLAEDDVPAALPTLKVPEGFTIELAASPPLVERPIVATFDDEGRLYVAESSGSNDPVQKQLADKPHRIVRLEDTDGDGRFDKRTVFADHMMFPEGAMFLDGSLYVSAPPSIWKLTDTDGDGVADKREEWFKGGTLTGCANDLHGPYAGPDGWIYWCKGAFGEQTHEVNGREWKTKASHIFRCRPDGSGFEPVITCGMDNPVDVAFMPDGERILSGTYFADNPRHDGLAHAIYGGTYGKRNAVLDGHPRTGELMPLLVTLSPAACCGLERYDCDVFGAEYRDNLFLCQFNLRKVSRHVLKPAGSTFSSEDSDFVWSDFVDFHPTDVVVDADGSLLVVDTGGWYKLCCPTSQLWKPDVLGGIYRVRRNGATGTVDPRGRKIDWRQATAERSWDLLGDERPVVRQRATSELARQAGSVGFQAFLREVMNGNFLDVDRRDSYSKQAVVAREWLLSRLDTKLSRTLLRECLESDDDEVRHVAMQSISLNRDAEAESQLIKLLDRDTAANRRVAAEALGRIGVQSAVPHLLQAAGKAEDRVLQHSVVYALIELADRDAIREGLTTKSPKIIAAALLALDQMPGGDVSAGDVIPHLNARDDTLRQAAGWIVRQHSEWGGELAQSLESQLRSLANENGSATAESQLEGLTELLALFGADPAVQKALAGACTDRELSIAARKVALRAMADVTLQGPPDIWKPAIATALMNASAEELPLAIATARRFPIVSSTDPAISTALVKISDSDEYPIEIRVDALSITAGNAPKISDAQFGLLVRSLTGDTPVAVRSGAADAISKSHLNSAQLGKLCETIQTVSPLELNSLFNPYGGSHDDVVGLKLIAALKKSTSIAALRLDLLREALAKYGPNVQQGIGELEKIVNVDAAAQRKRIEEMLPLAMNGDVRRGHAVFYSSKASCSSCHRLGYAGGTTGPDLSHVGQTRTERDILESILYPSLSFVRSYEPMSITTQDGKTINGIIKEESAQGYVVATGPDQLVRLARGDVEEIQPGKVSIMPAGLDKQLSPQELGDLVAFLKNPTGQAAAKPQAASSASSK
jgi:putative membrane-bound dehydrogenase-like protein